jgi:hypothetical protein
VLNQIPLLQLLQSSQNNPSQINDLAGALGEEVDADGAAAFFALLAELEGAEQLPIAGQVPVDGRLAQMPGLLDGQSGKFLPPVPGADAARGGNLLPQVLQGLLEDGEELDLQQLQQMRTLLQQLPTASTGQDTALRESALAQLQALTQSAQPSQQSERSLPGQALQTLPNVLNWQEGERAQPVARQLLHMVQQGQQQARLHIHPEHLGSIDIRLRVDGDSAQVSFSAANSQVREVLEQSLPRLREMFAEAGLELTDAGVDTGHGEHAAGAGGQTDAAAAAQGDTEEGDAESVSVHLRPDGSSGLLDTFA